VQDEKDINTAGMIADGCILSYSRWGDQKDCAQRHYQALKKQDNKM
jgi:hypothetical protein